MKTFIHSAKEARSIDAKAISQIGIPSLVLMEHAASAMCRALQKDFPHAKKVLILCGSGNNGADGLALARLLLQKGIQSECFISLEGRKSPEFETQLGIIKNLGIPIKSLEDFSRECHGDLIVDALFGSGLSRPLEGMYKNACIEANASDLPVVSVDIASGLMESQDYEIAVKADATYALDCIKLGSLVYKGLEHSGKTYCLDISIPSFLHDQSDEQIEYLSSNLAASVLKNRLETGHKGDFGKVLLCGGSFAMQGALDMAAKACFAAGAGTITLFAPTDAARAIASKSDLFMMIPAAQINGYFDPKCVQSLSLLVHDYDTIACGNGMGRGLGAAEVCKSLLTSDKKLVVDADGINVCCRFPILLERPADTIITPHVMEFSRISGFSKDEILANPFECMKSFLKSYPFLTVVLKSDWTLIGQNERMVYFHEPVSVLSKGGSGDVLCGLITGLLAQGYEAMDACILGVWIHNDAARDLANQPWSATPLDVIAQFPNAFQRLINLRK